MAISTNKRLNNIAERFKNEEVEIAVGTGQTQIDPTDSDLQNELIRKTASHTDTGVGQVLAEITIGANEAVGEDIGEAGNVDTDGDVVSHITFSPENKSSDEEFIIEIESTVE